MTTTMKPKQKGVISELQIIAKLSLIGYHILLPIGDNERYDIVANKNDKFLRIQCKTGKIINNAVQVELTSSRMNTKKTYRRTYVGQIDAFAIYEPTTKRIFLIPIDVVKNHKRKISLRLNNKTAKNSHSADKYEMLV